MTETYKNLFRYIAGNDLKKTRAYAQVILKGSKSARDAAFCENILRKMEEQDQQGVEIPFNLKTIIRTSCSPFEFNSDRYFLTEREKTVIEHIRKMYSVSGRLSELGIRYTNAVLLHGVSGTGKTTFAQYVAKSLGLPFFYVSITQLIDCYLGKTGQNLESVFEFANSMPCVLVLDEIDQIGSRRLDDGGTSGEMKRVLITILQNLDRLPNDVILIAATNRPDVLDEALVRRFAVRHEVTRLSFAESVRFTTDYMSKTGLGWTGSVTTFLHQLGGENAEPDGMTPALITQRLNEKIAEALYTGEPDPTVWLNKSEEGENNGQAQET